MRALVLAVAAVVLLAPPAAGGAVPVTGDVLSNGMRVLVRESPDAGVVAVSLQVKAGSAGETPETAGIVNFLHRVMLRGAGRRTSAQLAEAADAIGGSLDASGDVETAEIRGAALARHWETLLGLVSDVALAPTLAPDEVERERRLILSRIQARADDPFLLSVETLMADLYGRHPYGLPPLGRRASIERVTRDTLLAEYRALYRPDRMVLAVSGRVTRERVVRFAERRFGRLPTAADAAVTPPSPPVPRGERRVLERPANQAQIVMGFLSPGIGDGDYAAVKVLAAALGGGMAGRLFIALRGEGGLAYSVGAVTPFRTGPGFLMAYMGTAPDNVTAAEAGMRRELDRVKAAGISEGELARAKAFLAGALVMDRRTNARHAWYLAHFEAVGAGRDFPERYARAVQAVTRDDVVAAARRYLGPPPTVVVLEPRR